MEAKTENGTAFIATFVLKSGVKFQVRCTKLTSELPRHIKWTCAPSKDYPEIILDLNLDEVAAVTYMREDQAP